MGKNEIGGKPKGPKVPNKYKQDAKAARDKGPVVPEIQNDEFGDGSYMREDYRPIPNVVGDVIMQKGAICWAVALARLLQAIYNLNLEDMTSFLEFLHDDLVKHLKPQEANKKVPKLELGNIKKAVAHIKTEGLLTVKSSRSSKAGGSGHHEKWEFKVQENATAESIKEKLRVSPVAASFHVGAEFQDTKEGIYQVKILTDVISHMVLIVGYGYTKDEKLFFLIQNSWGKTWGVNGYARIFIDDNSGVTMIYPVV